jgi:hypothetical protein
MLLCCQDSWAIRHAPLCVVLGSRPFCSLSVRTYRMICREHSDTTHSICNSFRKRQQPCGCVHDTVLCRPHELPSTNPCTFTVNLPICSISTAIPRRATWSSCQHCGLQPHPTGHTLYYRALYSPCCLLRHAYNSITCMTAQSLSHRPLLNPCTSPCALPPLALRHLNR